MFIIIYLKSKNIKSLNLFLKILDKFSTQNKFKNIFTIRKIKRFTILKSPHVNKTAQQQFEYRLYSKKILVENLQIFKILIILKKIKINLCCDVLINIKFGLFNNNKIDLKEDNIFSKNKHLKTKLKLLNYNYYGKNNFINNLV